ncbi:CIR protein [Plasmodium chabaudi chabaudi]|uniref:CIR protein n=1 Tax=Plasmodium chabaudi chabaudi TaxID=31271 RepID=A0A4V6M910_PLACU|nr:CIR protein [Plasmodium chabaudi chabaudi]VTZ67604.1 CIR protein [Plasmodium chabaudi chabaudi]|eukprot:XP_016653369.1 CIR protein [Plasmodium chabaudi chabaudi]
MDKNVCKLFVDVDKLFTKGSVDETLFNDPYKNFCPKGGCNTNYDRLGALCGYLLAELPKLNNNPKGSEDNANQNYEFIFMWLADKFLKISPDRSFSLNDYYEKVIVKQGENFNCWEKLDNKKDFKDSNLSIMSLFYQLFMNICSALMKNEISNFELKKFKDIDYDYYQIFDLINTQVSNCDPYVQLLINFKKTYDEYKGLVINKIPKNEHDNIYSLACSPINNNDDQPELLFESNGCKQLHEFFQQIFQKHKPKKQLRRSKYSSNGEGKHKGSKKDAQQSTKKENQPLESKASYSSQKSDTQAQTIPKSSQKLQEASPNNNHVSSNVTGAPKDMENVSVNHVNNQEIAKTRSRRGLSLQQNHQTSNHNESLSQLSEKTVENTPVESSDKLEDTRSEPAKRIKRNVPQDKPPNQEGNPEKKTPNSSSEQSQDIQKSSDSNKELNIKKVIDCSVDFFQACSSLFNDTVNKIEGHIHDMVISKVDDIIDKIPKYQQIIQKVCSSIGQIQIVNDHQNGSEKSQNEKVEQPTTQTNEGAAGCLNDMPPMLVAETGNYIMGLNGNINKLLSFNFEGYKVSIMALMAVSIPIALVIMYKYLYYGWGKTSKKKKMVKKIINSHNGKRKIKKIINPIDGKRTLKTVINPIDGKNISNTIISLINVKRTLKTVISSIDEKNTENATISPNSEETNVKTTIDSDCEEKTTILIINSYDEKDVTIQSVKSSSPKTTSLKGYKHIFANPAPFINLFFLLIFFVYKRKYNFL